VSFSEGIPVIKILTGEEFAHQFLDFGHTTWKRKFRDRYNVSGEREEFEDRARRASIFSTRSRKSR
jgi:hypothetical protein